MTALSREERITVLLESYVDVVSGIRDRGDGDPIPLMCAAWNHPAYRQLDRLLARMRDERGDLYRDVAAYYVWAEQRRVLVCARPGCDASWAAWEDVAFHRHGRTAAAVVPGMVRIPSWPVSTRVLVQGVAWLEREWDGDVFVPDELLPSLAKRGSREQPEQSDVPSRPLVETQGGG